MMRHSHTAIRLLASLAVVCAPAAASPAAAQVTSSRVEVARYVGEAALRFGVPRDWIWAVMRAESAGRIDAVSPAGARGLMQLMPATWAAMRDRYGLGSDPFDPRDNILAGAAYLRELFDRYGVNGFLAAYNAGPGRFEDWRDRGKPLPAETRSYVSRIAATLQSGSTPTVFASAAPAQSPRRQWTQGALFAARSDAQTTTSVTPSADARSNVTVTSSAPGYGLFVPVSGSRSQ